MKIAFLYEHPTWSEKLIQAFGSRNISISPINIADLWFDTSALPGDYDAVINRVNIMPSADRDPKIVFQTLHYLNWLDLAGVPVINGCKAHTIGSSKALQNGIFSGLGLHHPRGIAVYSGSDVLQAAKQIGYPLIVKPNIGGSGSGITRYENPGQIDIAIKNKMLDLGIDGSGIVQQYIESDGYVYRVEVLGENLFYSIRQPIVEGSFNYCAADGCSTQPEIPAQAVELDFCVADGGQSIQKFEPPKQVLSEIIEIIRRCEADVGGVEYLIDSASEQACYYDFNPYSNFVSNGDALLGFSPEDRYIDFVMEKIGNHDRNRAKVQRPA